MKSFVEYIICLNMKLPLRRPSSKNQPRTQNFRQIEAPQGKGWMPITLQAGEQMAPRRTGMPFDTHLLHPWNPHDYYSKSACIRSGARVRCLEIENSNIEHSSLFSSPPPPPFVTLPTDPSNLLQGKHPWRRVKVFSPTNVCIYADLCDLPGERRNGRATPTFSHV